MFSHVLCETRCVIVMMTNKGGKWRIEVCQKNFMHDNLWNSLRLVLNNNEVFCLTYFADKSDFISNLSSCFSSNCYQILSNVELMLTQKIKTQWNLFINPSFVFHLKILLTSFTKVVDICVIVLLLKWHLSNDTLASPYALQCCACMESRHWYSILPLCCLQWKSKRTFNEQFREMMNILQRATVVYHGKCYRIPNNESIIYICAMKCKYRPMFDLSKIP